MNTSIGLPFLVAFFVAVAAMTTNTYQICAWNVGTLNVDPWRIRTAPARLCRRLHSWFSAFWRHRFVFACLAIALVLFAVDAHASHAPGHVLTAWVVAARPKLESELKEATNKAKDVMTKAENEKRELSEEERKSVQVHLDEAKRLKASIDRIDGDEEMRKQIEALNAGPSTSSKPGETPRQGGQPRTLGQQFIASALYETIKAGKHHHQGFSGAVDVELVDIGATTLDESTGSGGKLVLPDYQVGILPLMTRPIRVTQLLAPGTTNSNSVEYMKETTFTNAAAARAEGAAAAESTLVFDRVADPVRSIAHTLPVTNEMLEDQGQIMSYIDGRLRTGLDLAEEDQLLNGSGAGANLTGLLNRAGLAADQARGVDTNADAIFKQIIAIMNSSFLMPDGLVVNPTNWQTIVLAKDGNGQYYGMGPFSPIQVPILWGLPAAVTPVIVANTALVGAYRQAAQRFVRRGGTITASNSHSDFFTKRLTAILAEMREALCVYRPGAFGKVTGLN